MAFIGIEPMKWFAVSIQRISNRMVYTQDLNLLGLINSQVVNQSQCRFAVTILRIS